MVKGKQRDQEIKKLRAALKPDDEAARELRALRQLWSVLWEHINDSEGEGVEGWDLLEIARKAGLIVCEPYDPEGKHARFDLCGDPEKGDPVYVPTGLAKEVGDR